MAMRKLTTKFDAKVVDGIFSQNIKLYLSQGVTYNRMPKGELIEYKEFRRILNAYVPQGLEIRRPNYKSSQGMKQAFLLVYYFEDTDFGVAVGWKADGSIFYYRVGTVQGWNKFEARRMNLNK